LNFLQAGSSQFELMQTNIRAGKQELGPNIPRRKYARVVLVRHEAAIKSRLNQMLELWTIRVFLIWRRTGRGTREVFSNFCRVAD